MTGLIRAGWIGLGVLFVLTSVDALGQALLWENAHWTLASAAAAVLAVLAVRRAPAAERRARAWIAVGFGCFLGGQVAWMVQLVVHVATVPAASDLLFLASAVPIAWGFVTLLREPLTRTARLAFGIDATLVLATLLLLLWVAFGDTALLAADPLAGAVLLLYPSLFLGVASIAALAALRARVVAQWTGINLLLLGMAATGIAWIIWVNEAIVAIPPVGSPVNYAFSVAWFAAGIGAARLDFARSAARTTAQMANGIETLFPMLAVAAAIAAVMLVEQFGLEAWDSGVQASAAFIVLLALARQSILMTDRQRMSERDRATSDAERAARTAAEAALAAHRASEERYRQVVEVFARLGEQLSFAADEMTLIRGGVAALRRLVTADAGDLLLANPSQDRLVVGTAWGPAAPAAGDAIDGLAPLACLGIRRGSIYHVADVADVADDLVLPCPAHPVERGSLMCVPMLALGETIGVVHLTASGASAFSLDDERQAQRVAEQVALAIANARLVRTMESMALTDPLTRLHNARFFDPFLERELASSERDGQPLGVIMIDLDRFKAFNDEHGHPAGDEALRAFARAALTVLRDSDTLARYGGEEFVVAVRGAGLEEAALVAERLRTAVEGASIEIGPGRYAHITASLGVASTTVHGYDRPQLLKHADRALYRAKRDGRNRVVSAGAPRLQRRVPMAESGQRADPVARLTATRPPGRPQREARSRLRRST